MSAMIASIAHLGLIDEDAIALDHAALELAALDHPDADMASYASVLAAMAADLITRGRTLRSHSARATLLSRIIAGEAGLKGDSLTYDDPANADLIATLERKRGLPITLSLIYVALARRAGWPADALDTPGHVVVRIGADAGSVMIDAFNGGARLSPGGFTTLFAQLMRRKAAADPVFPLSNRAALVRLLMNQATRAQRAGNLSRALTLHERMTTIAPGFPALWWERARLEQQSGQIGDARASLAAMLETTRDADLRTHIRTALGALARSMN
jgi:regulator of sirC expression with transglutaminase-like and TPR domain